MGLLETARDALKDLPVSDILRERLSLALDQASASEKKLEELRTENADLKAELKLARFDLTKKGEELTTLREAMKEEVRIFRSIEFRRGARTGGRWAAFCPKCHCPAQAHELLEYVHCSDHKCQWISPVIGHDLETVIASL
jgi:hypothetical protein